jgi:hypothetical protein
MGNDMIMNDEPDRMWKEEVTVCFILAVTYYGDILMENVYRDNPNTVRVEISGTSETKGLPDIRTLYLTCILVYLVTSWTDLTI